MAYRVNFDGVPGRILFPWGAVCRYIQPLQIPRVAAFTAMGLSAAKRRGVFVFTPMLPSDVGCGSQSNGLAFSKR